MTVNDQIADMLTRIRNAVMAHHDTVLVPNSRSKLAIAKILREEGFVSDYEITRTKPFKSIKIKLRYRDGSKSYIGGLQRASKPGLRLYVRHKEIPRVYGGIGVAIISTSHGVMTGQKAWKNGIGGELLCYVW